MTIIKGSRAGYNQKVRFSFLQDSFLVSYSSINKHIRLIIIPHYVGSELENGSVSRHSLARCPVRSVTPIIIMLTSD